MTNNDKPREVASDLRTLAEGERIKGNDGAAEAYENAADLVEKRIASSAIDGIEGIPVVKSSRIYEQECSNPGCVQTANEPSSYCSVECMGDHLDALFYDHYTDRSNPFSIGFNPER